MKYLGVDYGKKRIGLSYADGVAVAVPIQPIVAKPGEDIWKYLAEVIRRRKIEIIVVGYPLGMDDNPTPWTLRVERFIGGLTERFALPVHKSDERLTSFQVNSDLVHHELRVRRNNMRRHRETGVDDSRAATLILQDFLDEFPEEMLFSQKRDSRYGDFSI